MSAKFEVSFTPSSLHFSDIEKWLFDEYQNSDDGFYCNMNLIKSSFENNELAVIVFEGQTIGFATFNHISNNHTHIDLFEIKPYYRRRGFGAIFLKSLFNLSTYLTINSISPIASCFFESLGFLQFEVYDGSKSHYINLPYN